MVGLQPPEAVLDRRRHGLPAGIGGIGLGGEEDLAAPARDEVPIDLFGAPAGIAGRRVEMADARVIGRGDGAGEIFLLRAARRGRRIERAAERDRQERRRAADPMPADGGVDTEG